ncbi:hypothetical protein CDAR_592241 [Caerostris darwini]|uniref:Uncharacterized protein n=1 Tax=Caerostris darwini TaxID=1538125 RepID=A0AAV4PK90_9ARAC|nr:hypothetical protein CDAR_592241 [Caerostris darwini]
MEPDKGSPERTCKIAGSLSGDAWEIQVKPRQTERLRSLSLNEELRLTQGRFFQCYRSSHRSLFVYAVQL